MYDFLFSLVKTHGPIAASVVAVGYMLQRHTKIDRRAFRDATKRLADLEADRVTKHDLELVFDRISAVSTQIQTNQNVLLTALAQRNGRSPD